MKCLAHLLLTILLLPLLVACAVPASTTQSTTTVSTTTTFPLTIQHEDGATTFTAPVARIVTLSEEMMELPIALGIYPVGTASERVTTVEQGDTFTYSYAPAVSQTAITYVGLESAPSLEAIALLQPDLIITPNGYGKERYAQLSQIAPTLTFDGADRLYWQEALRLLAQLTGKSAEAEQVSTAFDTALAEARTQLAPIVAAKPRLALLFLPAPTMTFMINQQFAFGATFADLGMTIVVPEKVEFNEAGSAQVSDEIVAQVETDAFVSYRFSTERFTIDELLASHSAPKLDYIINPERPAAGPITDFDYLRDLTALLVNAHGATTMTDTVATVATVACAEGFRRFEHALLTTDPVCIPENPQRIIALDVASVELTIMTGKTLLATSNWILSEMPLMSPQFAETLSGVEDVGYPANLEKILLLKPDLILAVGGTNVGETIDVEQAMQIAPVVVADPVIYEDWKLGTQFWSEVLNVTDFYSAMEENYFTRVSELQAALGDPAALAVSVIGASTYGIYLWMPDTPPGQILRDVGLSRPEAQSLIGEASLARYQASQYVLISEERLDLVDGDALFYFTYFSSDAETADKEQAFLEGLAQKPLWQALNAVKAGKAFQVPSYWWRAQTYLLANRVIDDLFTHLTTTTATTPVLEGRSLQ